MQIESFCSEAPNLVLRNLHIMNMELRYKHAVTYNMSVSDHTLLDNTRSPRPKTSISHLIWSSSILQGQPTMEERESSNSHRAHGVRCFQERTILFIKEERKRFALVERCVL